LAHDPAAEVRHPHLEWRRLSGRVGVAAIPESGGLMQLRARDVTVIAGLLLVLALVNWQIVAKERVLRDGELMLLELAPVDPRSLIQGDYMRLDYAIGRTIAYNADWPDDGQIIVGNDENGVARYVQRFTPGTPIGADEHLLRYRRRGGVIRIGTDAFYF